MIEYDKNCAIHKDTKVNKFIHEILQKKPEIKLYSTPSLSLIVSNNNAIVPLLTTMINISPINFYLSGLNVQCINKGRR